VKERGRRPGRRERKIHNIRREDVILGGERVINFIRRRVRSRII